MATETRKQIDARIRERFDILRDFTVASTTGDCRSLIVSGPAGLGKSFTVEKAMDDYDPTKTQYGIVKGFVKTTGLIRMLWKHRFANHVIVFDDADSLFWDMDAMNLLKSVCDTCERRFVSYLSEYQMEDEDAPGELIPHSFEVEASIIFLTNLDFDKLINKGNKLAPHMAALVSRSHYIDLAMKTKEDYLVRINQVVAEGMLDHLTNTQRTDVMNFIADHQDKLRELSLRMAIKLATIRKMNGDWQKIARVTCCRN